MRTLIKILFLLGIVAIASCKKYEDGPSFSLMTKKARLANIWYVDKYYINDVDQTESYRQQVTREKLTIFQSGQFDYNEVSSWVWAPMNYAGTWKLMNDQEDLEMDPEDPSLPVQKYHILRLKKNELWLEQELFQGFVVEYHYLPIEE